MKQEYALADLEQDWSAAPTVQEISSTSIHEIAVAAILLLVLVLTLNFSSLLRIPDVHPDEGWYANLAQNWIETGNRWTTIDVGPYPQGRGRGTSLLNAVLTRLAIQLGGLNLRALRMVSFVASVVALGSLALIGKQLWNSAVGCLAALLFALSQLYLMGSHVYRPEVWLTGLVLLSFASSLKGWRSRQPLWDMLAALLAGASVLIHPNGVVFALALAATYLARYGRQTWRQPGALAFAAVGFLGGVGYLVWMEKWKVLGTSSDHSIPLLSQNPLLLPLLEIARYSAYVSIDPLWASLFALGLLLALHRRTIMDRILFAWLSTVILAMMLLVSRNFSLYLLPTVAIGALLIARSLTPFLAGDVRIARKVVLLLIFLLLVPHISLAVSAQGQNPLERQRELQAVVPCERIMASNEYWLSFTDCDFRSFDLINHYHYMQGLSLSEAMAAVKPDYLIVNASIWDKLADDFGEGGTMYDYYRLPREDFERFLAEKTTLIYLERATQVYQVHWTDEP